MKIFNTIVLLIILLSCNNKNEFISKEIKKDTFIPDINVNDVELSNNKTFLNGYKNLQQLVVEDNNDLPFVNFENKEGTEKFTIYFFYGSSYDEFYQFKIEYSNGEKLSNHLKYDRFITESGIKLGISKKELFKIKGYNCNDKNGIIKYVLSNYETSSFLQKYNLPVYFSEYTFREDKLVKIFFGFKYP